MTHLRPSVSRALSVCVAVVLALLFAAASACAERGHVYGYTFGAVGTGNGQLSGPQGIAVNEETGRVYVVDSANDRVEFFSSSGVFEGEFDGSGTLAIEKGVAAPNGHFSHLAAIAVDNSTNPTDPSRGDIYVPAYETEVDVAEQGRTIMKYDAVYKYSAGGEYLGEITGTPECESGRGAVPRVTRPCPFNERVAVAVDTQGRLWLWFYWYFPPPNTDAGLFALAWYSNAVVNKFEGQWRKSVGNVGYNSPLGLAVDGREDAFITDAQDKYTLRTTPAAEGTEIERTHAFCGVVPGLWPDIETSDNDIYLSGSDRVVRCDAEGRIVEYLGEGHLGEAAGVTADSKSGVVFVVDHARDDVQAYVLEPPGKPSVQGDQVSEVSSQSAVFAGQVNPRTEVGEQPTTYRFEYGSCPSVGECAGSAFPLSLPVGGGSLVAAYEGSTVRVNPQGLSPHAVYHFRLVAENQYGQAVGREEAFVTQVVGGPLVLPDARRWELVSPPNSQGSRPYPIAEDGLAQAAVSGGGVTYLESLPTEAEPHGFAGSMQVLSCRGAEGGWSSVDLAAPSFQPVGAYPGFGMEYRAFSEDLGVAVLEQPGPFNAVPHEFPEPTERTPYQVSLGCPSGTTSFAPIATGSSEGGDVREGIRFGGNPERAHGDVMFVDATPDGAHVFLSSTVALTEATAPGGGIYEWTADAPASERLRLVSILPEDEGGKAAPNPVLGGSGDGRGAVSLNGDRLFFTAQAQGQSATHLYVRDLDTGMTVRIDTAEGGSPLSQAPAVFQAASSDGSRVFFTSVAALTIGAASETTNLYECHISVEGEAAKQVDRCALRDLTPVPSAGRPGEGEAPLVLGVLGISTGGSYVYFVAEGVQATGAIAGRPNLYVEHEGTSALVATLSADDSPDWGRAGNRLEALTARVSSSGRWVAFMSDRQLTGYENVDAVSGKPDEEVFLYDLAGGHLVCASCNPTGERPSGVEYARLNDNLAGGDRVWPGGQWIAANIPGWTAYSLSLALYESRVLSNQGRLFFNSSDSLVPQDANGNEDVYEYEPAGVGSCAQARSTFVAAIGGCVSLVSSGVVQGESAFMDASESGSDVFFLSAEDLAGSATGSGVELYDAHECSTTAPCSSEPSMAAPECTTTDSCRSAPSPQPTAFGAPASATFNGAGNLSVSLSRVRGAAPKRAVRKSTRAQRLRSALRVCRKRVKGKTKAARMRRVMCERAARRGFYGKAKTKLGAKKANAKRRNGR